MTASPNERRRTTPPTPLSDEGAGSAVQRDEVVEHCGAHVVPGSGQRGTSRDTHWPFPEPAGTASLRSRGSVRPTESRRRPRPPGPRTRPRSVRSRKWRTTPARAGEGAPLPEILPHCRRGRREQQARQCRPCTGLAPVSYPTIASSDDDVDRCHPASGSEGTDSPVGEISRPPLPSAPYNPWHAQLAGPIIIMMPASSL